MERGNKWLSRKFLNSLVVEMVGIATLIWGLSAGELVQTIAGAVITVAVVLGYVFTEASIDKESIKKSQ